jgi:predicted peroxiredoxin
MFFAGDGVTALTAGAVENLAGLGTGRLAELLPALAESGVPIYASGMSAKARGVAESLAPLGVELAMPARLVELAVATDTVLVY